MTLRWRTRAGCSAIAMAALVLGGCSSGSGPLVTASSGAREDPGSTRDQPPSTRDAPGGQCLECGVTYRCTSAGGPGQPQDIELTGSMCTPALIDLVCSGALFAGGAPCTGGGGGPFTCGGTTCVPDQSSQTTPQPVTGQLGGSSGVDAG